MKKTLILLLAAITLATAQAEQDWQFYDVAFVVNPELPRDTVEAVPIQAGVVRFYAKRPKQKPKDLPKTWVLVRVVAHTAPEHLTFVGWFWLDPKLVNQLHEDPEGRIAL